MEAYPTLKTRIGLPSLSLPPLLVPVAAVVIGAVALFLLPLLLGIGNPPGGAPTASPGPSAGASESPALPTALPEPTQLVYVVQAGDTMQRIADRFGITLAALIDANRDAIPNPDLIKIGQQVIIPVAPPTTLPDAGATDTLPPP
jgi:LysM domain